MSTFKLTSESDAYEFLELIKNDLVNFDDNFKLEFDGWPKLNLRLVGEGFQATITPTIMMGIIEFQKSIYKSFALAKYNSNNVNKLTKQEKQDLEIRVKVEEGSSKLGIDFQAIAEKFMENVSNKLSSKAVAAIVVSVAVCYFGDSAYRAYLEERKQAREVEAKSEEQRALIETLKFNSQEETKRTKLLVDMSMQYHQIANVKEYSNASKVELVKSLKNVEHAELGSIAIDGEVAEELMKNARKTALDVRLDGEYRVLLVDSSDNDKFKIKIKDLTSGEIFTAIVQDDTLELKYREIIQQAEWDRTRVKLSINAKEKDGVITQATVIKAEKP